jgi:hypothetical protein
MAHQPLPLVVATGAVTRGRGAGAGATDRVRGEEDCARGVGTCVACPTGCPPTTTTVRWIGVAVSGIGGALVVGAAGAVAPAPPDPVPVAADSPDGEAGEAWAAACGEAEAVRAAAIPSIPAVPMPVAAMRAPMAG